MLHMITEGITNPSDYKEVTHLRKKLTDVAWNY